ncbi:MAG: sulfurtransferase [Acidimicrobiia bacterium]|nr:sulfurtransferase [Acidimicrobiia bacterium]
MTFGPLVTTTWLAAHLDDPQMRLADCRWYLGEPDRGSAEYRRGHIPGAVYVSLDDDLSAPTGPGRHPLPQPEDYAARLGSMGFGDDAVIVAYDDRGGAIASRLWWMLRSIGHRAVAVLDGGLTAWLAEGRPTSTLAGTHAAEPLTVRARPRTIDAATLEENLGSMLLIDARDADRYRGEHEPVDPVAGHIPSAINVPMTGNLRDDARFLDAGALHARYADAGVTGRESVVYCGSGVTACHDILAMEIAGLPTATLYPGSWSDWSSSGRRVMTGEAPGTR